MTLRQKAAQLESLKSLMKEQGFAEDKYGNFVRTDSKTGKTYRYKFTKIGLRYESLLILENKKYWTRIRSGYMKDISVDKGQIVGLSY